MSNERKMDTINIPEMEINDVIYLTKVDNDNYMIGVPNNIEMATKKETIIDKAYRESLSTYSDTRDSHLYSHILDNENNNSITSLEEICDLAKNTQINKNKVIKINGIVKYYINKEDLIGRVVETIENNINTNYSLNYSYIPKTKKDKKHFEEVKSIFDKFNKQINIEKIIQNNGLFTYIEGNNILYLLGDKERGYTVTEYPLDMIEVTSLKIDGDNVVTFDVDKLKGKINKVRNNFKNIKSNKTIDVEKTIDDDIKKNYPEEVYNAYKQKDKKAIMSPQRIGVVRINNLKGYYGVTPIFKSLTSQLMLETVDTSDQKVLIQKTKKIYYQKTRKEILPDGDVLSKIGYAQNALLKAMGKECIVYTAPPWGENLEILEPKTDLTDEKTKLSYKLRILEALGISFISSEGSTSITTTKINYTELLKVINRITNQLQDIINKWYEIVCEENGIDLELKPSIVIENTQLLDLENKLKLTELLYSKIGVSYDTIFRMLGLNPDNEIRKRIEENNVNIDGVNMTTDDIMSPHITSFTATGKEEDTIRHNNIDILDKNTNGSKKSENEDKSQYDQQYQGKE